MASHAELSPEIEPTSPSTAVTTPEQQSQEDEDIWGSHSPTNTTTNDEMLSDLPTIKRQHMTDGYREGLSVGKAQVMQQGFDEGYPIGVQIAMRAGLILGVLEGYLASKSISPAADAKATLQKTYVMAQKELSCPALLRDLDDQLLAGAKTVPPLIEMILSRWEVAVMGPPNRSEP